MIIGLGNDIQAIEEVENLVESQPNFIQRILTEKEQLQLKTRSGNNYIQYIAGRFSAKEAYAKATGFGIGEHARWLDIEILNDEDGKPQLTVSGKSVMEGADNYLVALSHNNGFVLANVIVESKDV